MLYFRRYEKVLLDTYQLIASIIMKRSEKAEGTYVEAGVGKTADFMEPLWVSRYESKPTKITQFFYNTSSIITPSNT